MIDTMVILDEKPNKDVLGGNVRKREPYVEFWVNFVKKLLKIKSPVLAFVFI